jgi:hypothetical protein
LNNAPVTGATEANTWAVINADGTTARGSGVRFSEHISTGVYAVEFQRDVSQCAAVATLGTVQESGVIPEGEISVLIGLFGPDAVQVRTTDSAGNEENQGFHLIVRC